MTGPFYLATIWLTSTYFFCYYWLWFAVFQLFIEFTLPIYSICVIHNIFVVGVPALPIYNIRVIRNIFVVGVPNFLLPKESCVKIPVFILARTGTVLRMSTPLCCSRLRHLCDGSHKSPEHARSQMVYCSDCQCTHTCTNCLAAFLGAFNIPLSFAILWPCPWHGPFDLRLPDGGQSNVASMDSKKIVFKALINI